MQITASTQAALEAVEANYESHKVEYQNQLHGWQEKMKEFGILLSDWAIGGGIDDERPKQPQKPEKFDGSYKRLILLLEVHTGVEITLDDHEFDQIFLDKFNWKGKFHLNSSLYTGNGNLLGAEYDEM